MVQHKFSVVFIVFVIFNYPTLSGETLNPSCQLVIGLDTIPNLDTVQLQDIYFNHFNKALKFNIRMEQDSAILEYKGMLKIATILKNDSLVLRPVLELGEIFQKRGILYFDSSKYESAAYYFQLGLEAALNIDNYEFVFIFYKLLGAVYFEIDKIDKAFTNYTKSIDLLEHKILPTTHNNESFQEKIAFAFNCYSRAISCAYELEKNEEAYQIVQRFKARSFNKLFSSRFMLSDSSLVQDVEMIKSSLSSEQAIIDYFLGDKIYAFVVTKKKFKVLSLGRGVEEAKNIARFQNLQQEIIQTKITTGHNDILKLQILHSHYYELNSILFSILEKHLKGTSELLIIPDQNLYKLAFEALSSEKSRNYLIERFPKISYYPSVSFFCNQEYLLNKREPVYYPKDLLLVAKSSFSEYINADFSHKNTGADLHRLSFSELNIPNVEEIQGLFKNVDCLIDEDACFECLMNHDLSMYRYIYISTHGFYNEAEPDRSFLALTKGRILYDDVFDMRLQNEVIILSACETGRGKHKKGYGNLGFPAGLLSSGAHAIVVSLWDVEEKATEELMLGFLEALAADVSPADALSIAKLKLRETDGGKYDNPYYWGAFVLFGKG